MTNLKPAQWTRIATASAVCRCGAAVLAAALLVVSAASAEAGPRRARLSSDLVAHLNSTSDASVDVIVTGSAESVDRLARRHGVRIKKFLSSGAVLSASRRDIDALAADGEFGAVSGNAIVRSHMAVTTAVTGAQAAWEGKVKSLGPVDGRGIGVAIIDSGIAFTHPALANRVIVNVDFTDPKGRGEDLYGHGTHIAGIVAARDFRVPVGGADSGMAPAAHLINLKVLGADGTGTAADLIEAIDWAIKYRKVFGIRVVNLSLGAAPTQGYRDDPICLAVERAVKAGLVVVASAGNHGQTEKGQLVLGSVTSPGISPYAITVGALRTQGTVDPGDDEVAPWSSKGPTLVDHIVKPDLVAPGSKIVSTAVKGSFLSNALADKFIDGPGARDYVAMSGTSMAAAVVSGAVALLLDGDGKLDAASSEVGAAGLRGLHAGCRAADGWRWKFGSRRPRRTENTSRGHSGRIDGLLVFDARVATRPLRSLSMATIIVDGERIVWGDVIIYGEFDLRRRHHLRRGHHLAATSSSTASSSSAATSSSTASSTGGDIIIYGSSPASIILRRGRHHLRRVSDVGYES